MDCCASEFEPGCFGFAMEVGGKGAVESFEFGEVSRYAGVDGMFEVFVGKTVEAWERSADDVCVVVMIGDGIHVAKYPDVFAYVFTVYRVLEVSAEDHGAFIISIEYAAGYIHTSVLIPPLRQLRYTG